ncbi:MAG: hypothetical protein K8T10_08520 [Candidatus Eremiobacteraeota bacterium]|nr:hypothetical protein [Candidatus Eremiobacteraeota bacterium]
MSIRKSRLHDASNRGNKLHSMRKLGGSKTPGDSVSIGGSKRDDQGMKALRENIKNLESMYAVMGKFGSKDKTEKLKASIESKKKLLEEIKNGPPPPEITEELKKGVADFISAKGTMPAGLDKDNQEKLEHFSSLVKNGMAFTDNSYKQLEPADAFCRLVGTKFHGVENQVMYRTYQDGMTALSTFRPEYVKPLDIFIKGSKRGLTFHEKTKSGYEPITTAADFIKKYKANPEEAVVKAIDGSFVKPEKALRMKAEKEIMEMIPEKSEPGERPVIIQKEDSVIIGGVVLKKNR